MHASISNVMKKMSGSGGMCHLHTWSTSAKRVSLKRIDFSGLTLSKRVRIKSNHISFAKFLWFFVMIFGIFQWLQAANLSGVLLWFWCLWLNKQEKTEKGPIPTRWKCRSLWNQWQSKFNKFIFSSFFKHLSFLTLRWTCPDSSTVSVSSIISKLSRSHSHYLDLEPKLKKTSINLFDLFKHLSLVFTCQTCHRLGPSRIVYGHGFSCDIVNH